MYQKVLNDTSKNARAWSRYGYSNYMLGAYDVAGRSLEKALVYKPAQSVKANTFASLARIYSLRNEKQKALSALDSAVTLGYSNLKVLDTLKDFQSVRSETTFKKIRERVYAIAYPCMVNPLARQFRMSAKKSTFNRREDARRTRIYRSSFHNSSAIPRKW